MSEAAQQWLATLSEVRRQAARAAVLAGVQPLESDGQWYDVAEDRTETSDLETLDETGAWRGLQWLNAFEILFFERPEELMTGDQQDDLLFFVVHEAYQGGGSALLVRRKGRAMPGELGRGGQQAERIDWRKSVLLNLVVQATYCLTVATCRRTDITELLQQGTPTPADAAKVSKAVYASPMNIQVDIEGQRSKEDQPSVGFPDICFAIEDFDVAFKGLIVSEPGWCYVVTLSATGGPATAVPPPPLQQQHPGLVSQSPAQGPGAALPGSMVLAATAEASHSSSAGPDGQSSLGLADSSASDAAPSEQFSSAAGSTIRDEHPDSEQPLHSTLAGMSLGGAISQSQPAHARASEPARAGIELHDQSTEASFEDPLRRGQRPDAQQDVLQDQGGDAVHHAGAAESAVDLPLFTGFVSHEQLETAIGSTSYERRLATSKELTHWVKMRGPGGQGHADVAITCLLPLDEGHLKPPAEHTQRAGRLLSRGSSPFQRVFNSVAASATEAAKGLVSNLLARDQGPDEYLRLRCALMRLSLPVELLAAQLLRLPLQDVLPDT